MHRVFVGSEALAAGALTRSALRWHYRRLFPDVYVPAGASLSLRDRTIAAWLWSGRGAVAGAAASALHGAQWVDAEVPIELIWLCGRPPRGIVVRNERIDGGEVTDIGGMLVTYSRAHGIRPCPPSEAAPGGGAARRTGQRDRCQDTWLDPVRTQIKVGEGHEVAYLDMGYDEPMVGLDYEGSHHHEDRQT